MGVTSETTTPKKKTCIQKKVDDWARAASRIGTNGCAIKELARPMPLPNPVPGGINGHHHDVKGCQSQVQAGELGKDRVRFVGDLANRNLTSLSPP